MTMARHHTRSSGPAADALREAFRLNCELLQSRGSDIMGLAVHTKAQLDGTVREVLGDEVVKGLNRNNRVQLKGITIQLLTEKIQVRKLDGPGLSAFVSPAKLDEIIACQGVTDLVFVPLEAAELQAYEAEFPESVPVFPPPRDGATVPGVQES